MTTILINFTIFIVKLNLNKKCGAGVLMEISRKKDGDVVIFTIVGDVSIFYKDSIDTALDEEVEKGAQLFAFDFSQVNYIDSVGISFLIQAGNISYENGKRIAIVGANPKVRYVIELAKLDRIIGLYDNMETALSDLKS